ncbi:MAG: hypothetical protein M0030_07765 [Actinomycetota bacterium]|nr:hypothetical protein [Actinomycetota bacterium]
MRTEFFHALAVRPDFVQAAGSGLGLALTVLTILALSRPYWVRRRNRKTAERAFWDQFRQDWTGVPDRAGVPGRPGVLASLGDMGARLGKVEKELHPNGGSSMKDQVNRIEGALAAIQQQAAGQEGAHRDK